MGYDICYYNSDKNSHGKVVGLGDVDGKDAVTSITESPDIVKSIQHELTHNLGRDDHCTAGQKCIYSGNLGYWCDACAQYIEDNY